MRAPQIYEHSAGGESLACAQPRWTWADDLPTLHGTFVDLRPFQRSDAHALSAVLAGEDVTRFITEPPTSVEAFERFIDRHESDARSGTAFVMAVVPHGLEIPVGLLQVRRLDPQFETAEWGFVVGAAFWGTGIFPDAAQLLLQFAFNTVGIQRLEARCVVRNGRGHGVLRKLGAVQEGVLRQAMRLRGDLHDQALWAILANEWRALRRPAADLRVH